MVNPIIEAMAVLSRKLAFIILLPLVYASISYYTYSPNTLQVQAHTILNCALFNGAHTCPIPSFQLRAIEDAFKTNVSFKRDNSRFIYSFDEGDFRGMKLFYILQVYGADRDVKIMVIGNDNEKIKEVSDLGILVYKNSLSLFDREATKIQYSLVNSRNIEINRLIDDLYPNSGALIDFKALRLNYDILDKLSQRHQRSMADIGRRIIDIHESEFISSSMGIETSGRFWRNYFFGLLVLIVCVLLTHTMLQMYRDLTLREQRHIRLAMRGRSRSPRRNSIK